MLQKESMNQINKIKRHVVGACVIIFIHILIYILSHD